VRQFLGHNSDAPLRVLVVWEPILPTDWRVPGRAVLGRIPDRRVKQFWDPEHLVARQLKQMAEGMPGHVQPDCCVSEGFFWDDAILYAPHAQWEPSPAPVYWNGPVIHAMAGVEKALSGQP
jgi:hypothetical protein